MIQLPPLPEPFGYIQTDTTGARCETMGYTADQLRADRLAVIEACAEEAERVLTAGRSPLGRNAAAALRALKEKM